MYKLLIALILLQGCAKPEQIVRIIHSNVEFSPELLVPLTPETTPHFTQMPCIEGMFYYLDPTQADADNVSRIKCANQMAWLLNPGSEPHQIMLMKRYIALQNESRTFMAPNQFLPDPPEPKPWYWPF